MKKQNLILNHSKILQKIRRIACEIAEQNHEEQELILVGIAGNGFLLAEMILEELNKINVFQTSLFRLELNKKTPLQSEIKLNVDYEHLHDKTIILVDDVLYTGRTLAYSLKPFLNARINKLQIAVLVDRDYKSFPIEANFVGYALSTTIKEHIDVLLENKNNLEVYLT